MDWKNHLEKNPIQKIEKTVNIKVKLPHVNKKTLARKRIFVQTRFSHSALNLERKISRRKTTRFFAPFPVSAWPKSLLQFDFKNHENVWTDLKKKTAPQYNSNSLNGKNRNIALLSLQLRSYKQYQTTDVWYSFLMVSRCGLWSRFHKLTIRYVNKIRSRKAYKTKDMRIQMKPLIKLKMKKNRSLPIP